MERGLFITLHAISRQIAAMPNEFYLLRLIHSVTRCCCPGERLWTANQLSQAPIASFLRGRNRQGFDIYLWPYANRGNAGYILLDLDRADSQIIATMRADGLEPCLVLQTSPGHLQAWVHVSATTLEPAVTTQIGRQLARTYGGDIASADWRHLGRLAGFTNQKPSRRQHSNFAPWVKVLHAQHGLARGGASLVEAAQSGLSPVCPPPPIDPRHASLADDSLRPLASSQTIASSLSTATASAIYSRWMNRLRIAKRFSPPDWSIADLWIAKDLLSRRTPLAQVHAILRLGSPGFPRRHSDPEDYLRRTLARAALELQHALFPARPNTAPRLIQPSHHDSA
jgi:RepB DNA-primase from phage plasmid